MDSVSFCFLCKNLSDIHNHRSQLLATRQQQEQQQQQQQKKKKRGLFSNPTKVVLLKNMVGPGQVDDDLQAETAEECGKHGTVAQCLIFEVGCVPGRREYSCARGFVINLKDQ